MVNISTITHLTHKTGNFYFTAKYDAAVIDPLLLEAQVRYEMLTKVPILPNLMAELNADLLRRSVHGTVALEGGEQDEGVVEKILTANLTQEQSHSEREITNMRAVYEMLDEPVDTHLALNESGIKGIHRAITANIEYYHNSPGIYRNEKVKVGNREHGGTYTPPKTNDDIKTLMNIFCKWINEPTLIETPLIRAAMAHLHLGKIHPFQDGNGRTARFVEALLLNNSGFKFVPKELSNYYYRNIDEYYIAFSRVEKSHPEDTTPFLSFFLKGFIASTNNIHKRVCNFVFSLSVRDFYNFQKEKKQITKRQHSLLMILLQTDYHFTYRSLYRDPTLSTLYENVSESTARRDLRKLTRDGYLHKDGDTYSINLFLLD